ncbi:MAG: hypothetical protein AAGN66_12215 [Acidobacteriota bacterium]
MPFNDSRVRDPRRELSDELAGALASPEGHGALGVARRLQQLGWLGAPGQGTGEQDCPEPVTDGPRPISVWGPVRRDGAWWFERPAPSPLGDHYADARRFPLDRNPGTRRIVFLGESVAAGYLYAPRLTPAGQLAEALGAGYDVVDLARTNERLGSLAETVERALQLRPEALVLFVGNNWNLLETPELSPFFPSVPARQELALALRRGGLSGALNLARRRRGEAAGRTFERIADLAAAAGVRVVMVLPEVDLAHWRQRQPVPWLPGDGVARWYAAYSEAEEALDAGDPGALAGAAERMLEIDGGACPTAHGLLATARRLAGDAPPAIRAARAEVDAAGYPGLCFLGAPQVDGTARRALLEAARRHGFATVDLQAIFSGRDDGVPGDRWFLDYCHLTAEGIAAVAVETARALGAERGPEASLSGVDPAAEATAQLGAAVHTAHRLTTTGPRRPLLDRALGRALDADPGVAAAMEDLLAARSGPGPAVLGGAQLRNQGSPHRLLLQHGWRWDHLDPELLGALCEALDARGHRVDGRSVRPWAAERLLRHHGVTAAGVDLTRAPYLWDPLERPFPEATDPAHRPEHGCFRAFWPRSSFTLVAAEGVAAELTTTLRLPVSYACPEYRAEVTVTVDGRSAGRLPVAPRWGRQTLTLPPLAGPWPLRRLEIRWPMPPEAVADGAMAEAVGRLDRGLDASLHPCFAEAFSILARSP